MKIRRKFQETKQKIFLKIVKNENEKKETAKWSKKIVRRGSNEKKKYK